MNSAVHITRSLGHIASRPQLLAYGATSRDIATALSLGWITRVRRGHYATLDAPSAARLAVRIGGRLAGVSAAATYGLWAGTDTRVHVAVARNASRLRTTPADGAVLHWVDAAAAVQCWRVPAEVAVRQTVSWADSETALACLDTALTAWGWTTARLLPLFDGAPAGDRVLAARARVGSGSGCESIVRQRLETAGIRVQQQVRIDGVGFVDMVVAGARLVVEVDGFEHHGTRRGFEEDRRRDAALAGLGFGVVRLTYRRIFAEWPECLAAIRAALQQLRKV